MPDVTNTRKGAASPRPAGHLLCHKPRHPEANPGCGPSSPSLGFPLSAVGAFPAALEIPDHCATFPGTEVSASPSLVSPGRWTNTHAQVAKPGAKLHPEQQVEGPPAVPAQGSGRGLCFACSPLREPLGSLSGRLPVLKQGPSSLFLSAVPKSSCSHRGGHRTLADGWHRRVPHVSGGKLETQPSLGIHFIGSLERPRYPLSTLVPSHPNQLQEDRGRCFA